MSIADSNTSKDYRKRVEGRFLLVDASIETARLLDERVDRVAVPIRTAFVVSEHAGSPPPMTTLLRGGRGGEVKIQLLLSMIWVAAKAPYDVTFPSRVWAGLLGLEEPERGGAARVNAAIRRLVESDYVEKVQRPGMPSRVMLLEETGSGQSYTHPGSHWDTNNTPSVKVEDRPRYLQVPKEFWTQGWISVLSGAATAMYLALIEQTRGKKYEDIWFSPAVAAKRYGLTDVTRQKGLRQLELCGLISVERKAISRASFDVNRFRNTYSIDIAQLKAKTPRDVPGIFEERPRRGAETR